MKAALKRLWMSLKAIMAPIKCPVEFLKKGENCYYAEQSTLFETRSVRHYQSG